MGKKKNLPILEHIEITGVAAEGKAIAKVPSDKVPSDKVPSDEVQGDDVPCTKGEGMVVFVSNCVPGDIVDLQVTKKKHSFMEARVLRIVHPSPVRCEPRCRHFGVCGGCKWQILPYEEQLKYKQQQIIDNLTRIGKIELPEISPILGSKHIYGYRNKLEFTCADRRWEITPPQRSSTTVHRTLDRAELFTPQGEEKERVYEPGIGFHIPGAFDKVLDIQECHLMPDINNRIRNAVRTYAQEHGLTFYNEHTHEGLLRNLIIRNNHKGELMLIVSFGERITPPDLPSREEKGSNYKPSAFSLLEYLHTEFPEIISLLYVENTKFNDTIGDLEVKVYFGEDHIIEEMEGLRFKVGPKSFYQTNTEQAYELYKVAREFAFEEFTMHNSQCTIKPLVYDLYTGTGTIANFVAQQARQVIGIEYVPEAIEDAKVNSKINNIENTLFFAGDMKDILNDDFIAQHGRPDIIITDPPRAGMHEDVVNVILNAEPQRIVYVSCNPATQARDLALLDAKYKVTRVQPVDMFPHTQHVENVVQLELRIEN